MTQMKEEEALPPVTERAEQIVNRAGEQIGRLAGQAMLRLQQTRQSLQPHEKANDKDALESASDRSATKRSTSQTAETNLPATERAEELVDQLGQRLGHWAIVSNLRARRVLGRLREDAEDIWVEAHGVRGSWQRKR
ncbi:MAG TPA: hypothetical protein VGM01_10630 [Ktedonobacteraceae bacterium]